MFGSRRCGGELFCPRSGVEFTFAGCEQLRHGPGFTVIARESGVHSVTCECVAACLALVLALCAATTQAQTAVAGEDRRPNVVFIVSTMGIKPSPLGETFRFFVFQLDCGHGKLQNKFP